MLDPLCESFQETDNQKWKLVVGSQRDKEQILSVLRYHHYLYEHPEQIEVADNVLSQKEQCGIYLESFTLPEPRTLFGEYGPYDRSVIL